MADATELALVDTDAAMLEVMRGFAENVANIHNKPIKITAETDRRLALPGADFVILCAAVQGQKRWETDRDILIRHSLPHQARECGGVAGLSCTLRQTVLVMGVARDMMQLCPQAILLDVANPMPRLLAAVNNFTSVPAYGFCQAATGGPEGYPWLARLLGKSIEEIDVVTAGLNHFAWVLSIREKATGRDLYGDVVKALQAAPDNWEWRLMLKWYSQYGLLPAGAVTHHAEHLPPDPDVQHRYEAECPFHGGGKERMERLAVLREIGEGKRDYNDALKNGAWEHPVWFADAIFNKKTQYYPAINVPNTGFFKGLPEGVTVEAPAMIKNGKVVPQRIQGLPPALLALLNNVAEAQSAAVRAGVYQGVHKEGFSWIEKAVDADFAVPPQEKEQAKAAMREMVAALFNVPL